MLTPYLCSHFPQDRRPDLMGPHGGFSHLVSSSGAGVGAFSSAPRLSHNSSAAAVAAASDFQPPYFPPPYQQQPPPQSALDFHHHHPHHNPHHPHHQMDPYGQINPFQAAAAATQHGYNPLHVSTHVPGDRSANGGGGAVVNGNLGSRRDMVDPLGNMHMGGYEAAVRGARPEDYMTGLRGRGAMNGLGPHGPHHGLGPLDQDPALLSLHANPLAGLEDASQVSTVAGRNLG
ncbi:hypothetical protein ElyMa_001299400 [Elysia marginata]|uniref:Uncharacterized protein n=1 Tax=Elysia marginata TaxID=1093978 RepID=A0AAV4IE99_9GAST|nr:hypothetical protein ElyMa_001299400 [Elysia marginata]